MMQYELGLENLLEEICQDSCDDSDILRVNSGILLAFVGPNALSAQIRNQEGLKPFLRYTDGDTYLVSSPIDVRIMVDDDTFAKYLKVSYHSKYGLICPPRFGAEHGEYTRVFLYLSTDRKLHLDDGNKHRFLLELERVFDESDGTDNFAALNYRPALIDLSLKTRPLTRAQRVIMLDREEWKSLPGSKNIGALQCVTDSFGRMLGDKMLLDSVELFNKCIKPY